MLNAKSNQPTIENSTAEDSKNKSFKEFLNSQQGTAAFQGTALALKSNMTTAVARINDATSIFIGNEAEQNFAQAVNEIVQSDAFTDELSQSIGIPLPEETEDQFVARAKAKMTDFLRKKLSK
ncbi:hypothetical protein [Pandoraea sp. PE-S2T-3]|uniref:hypothetical protein n=1 Tax=Pandoraea sp. PE-S2T-3 TaxID=1986993 RepID=UPI000B405D1A|nr:hypothetical protein [Pandoraea sp. PE-S2T-3]